MNLEKMIYDLLKEMNIKYKVLEHTPITSVKNCLFTLEGQQVKNLLLKAKKSNNIYLVILHDEKILDLSNLATLLNEKRLSFASEKEMIELTNCSPGVLTPFGLLFDKKR